VLLFGTVEGSCGVVKLLIVITCYSVMVVGVFWNLDVLARCALC